MSVDKDVVTLTFKDTELNDAGTYKCEASNKLGTVNTECTVEVQSTLYLLLSATASSLMSRYLLIIIQCFRSIATVDILLKPTCTIKHKTSVGKQAQLNIAREELYGCYRVSMIYTFTNYKSTYSKRMHTYNV